MYKFHHNRISSKTGLPTHFYILLVILLQAWLTTSDEYFSSTGHLTGLLHFEIKLADELKSFVQHEEQRLSRLKDFLNRTTDSISRFVGVHDVIENPINSYLTIKRLQDDWQEMKKHVYSVYLTNLARSIDKFPSDEDINGARVSLLRLQRVFVLSSKDIVEGLEQTDSAVTLGAEDAFEMGKLAYDREEYKLTASWMEETLRLLDEGRYRDREAVNRPKVLHYLCWSEYEEGDMEPAFLHAQQWYLEAPSDKNARLVMEYFNKTRMEESEADYQPPSTQETKKKKSPYHCTNYVKFEYGEEEEREQKLCRGEQDVLPTHIAKKLKCWYKTNHPLLRLKPARVEMLYPKPLVLIFRNLLTDSEMEAVKDIATPQLLRATVNNPLTGLPENIESRVSKSAWLRASEFEVVDRLEKKSEAVTGLDTSSAEPLQIANYGMGGHYERHFDFSRNVPLRPPRWKNRTDTYLRVKPEEVEVQADGERIATLLFYMSDVTQGGATIFMNPGLAVKPVKGDALFWYNLNHDGSGDYETCHAACPVLLGEKWASNRWFRSHGNEFRRKCNLTPEDDEPRFE